MNSFDESLRKEDQQGGAPAQQPIPVTDEMIARAGQALAEVDGVRRWSVATYGTNAKYILEAALGVE